MYSTKPIAVIAAVTRTMAKAVRHSMGEVGWMIMRFLLMVEVRHGLRDSASLSSGRYVPERHKKTSTKAGFRG
jgi:hypothetical protein